MPHKTVFRSAEFLRTFMDSAFIKLGVCKADTAICAEILITSDLRGIESHGIGRLRMYVDRIKKGLIETEDKSEIIREAPATAVIDGHHGIGMVIAYRAMQLAIKKAKQYGMGSVAVRNSTHFGIDGYYPLMAVKENMIGMSFTNARPSVAPTFSGQPTLGTNPIAFGAPTDENFPFLFDAATSITQRGKIEVCNRENKPIFDGWVIDNEGMPMQEPGEILDSLMQEKAALLPLGGADENSGSHKGYGLSTIVEILSSSLQSGAFLFGLSGIESSGQETRFKVGHFFQAIDVESFLPIDEFRNNIGRLLRDLRAVQKLPEQERIFTAGEKEYENELRVLKLGVPINNNLYADLKYVDDLLHLKMID